MKDFLVWFFTVAYPVGCVVFCMVGLVFVYCDKRGI